MFQREPKKRVGTVQVELVADAGAMGFNRTVVDVKLGSNLFRRLAGGNHAQDPPFGGRQIGERWFRLVIAPEVKNFLEHPRMREVVTGSRGFDFVIDPYFDLHLSRLLDAMAIGGKYVTCGLYDQYLALIQKPALPSYATGRELVTVMLRNLQIMGNCIGLTSDLQTALNDFDAGMLDVVIDSVFCGKQITEFLDRTYNPQDRLGKVVYKYD